MLGQETILLNYEAGAYYELNEVGSFIWEILQRESPVRVETIEAELLNTFDVEPDVCRHELNHFLNDMLREQTIEVVE